MGWVVVLTFFLGGADVKEFAVACPTAYCVSEYEAHALREPMLIRLRVWSREYYAKLPSSGKYVWPPKIDLQYD
jgi:hypothetical protein